MTSAPMSARIIEQNGPARTRVRSTTRTPARGFLETGTVFPFPYPLHQALGDAVDPVAGAAGAAPEDPRAVEGAQAREVVDVVDRLDRHGGPDLEPARLGAVRDEARPTLQLDDRDVERGLEAFRRGVERRERHGLGGAGVVRGV